MNKRIEFIDELRGLAVVFMIIFHTIYQNTIWFDISQEILTNPIVCFFQLGAQFLFISISGFSCSFSRSNYKRGAICIMLGFLITLVTYIITPKEIILFGILHFLGFSMIIYELIKKALIKIEFKFGVLISLTSFIFLYIIIYENIFFEQIKSIPLINFLCENNYLVLLGIPSTTFYSADYFPFIPWLFLFIFGSFCGYIFKSQEYDYKKIKFKLPILRILGCHSLLIYLIHIPIIIGVLFLVHNIFSKL